MKTKHTKTLIFAISLFMSLASYAQLKVDKSGRIGMGTNWPNSQFKCHIKGNLLLTNYPDSPSTELRLKVYPTSARIGSSRDFIYFWSDNGNSFNKLYAQKYYRRSDSTLKSNIQPIQNGLDEIMKLDVYSYSIQDNYFDKSGNKIEGTEKEYGFLSQEVEKAFPDIKITSDAMGIKLMDYDQIIPLLVASTKEQQYTIDFLKEKVSNLEEKIDALARGNLVTTDIDETLSSSKTILYQNRPNPFSKRTIIEYSIETDNFHSGSMLIFDMNGTLLKTYVVSPEENELVINGRELKAGMYMYALVVNDVEIDTKKMILSK